MRVGALIRRGLQGRWVSGLGCGLAALLVLTSAATTLGGERRVATVDHPATVAVTPESDATPVGVVGTGILMVGFIFNALFS